MRYFYQVNPPQ